MKNVFTNKLQDKISRAEAYFGEKKSVRSAIIFILRCWQYYMISNDAGYLNKAYYTAVTARSNVPASVELYLCLVFLETQLGNFDRAEELLADFNIYKNFYKLNGVIYYAIFYFLSAAPDIIAGKDSRVKRKLKVVRDLSEALPRDKYFLIIGAFEAERGDFGNAYDHFADSYLNGGNSVFLYIYLYRLFITQSHVEDARAMFCPFLCWSINAGLNLELAADHYSASVTNSLVGVRTAEKLYAQYPFGWLLKYICAEYAGRKDFSEKGYYYFNQAEHKQLDFSNLDLYLLTASYLNKKEDVRRYTVENYLRRPEKDFLLKVFAYHLILTNSRLSDLADKNGIIDFTESILDKRGKGRYFNSLYAFLIKESKTGEVDEASVKAAEALLEENLFLYEAEIKNPDAGYIWIYEDEKRDRGVYKISDGKARIKSVSDDFRFIITDDTQKNILEEPGGNIIFRKLIENADEELYLHFYDKSSRDSDLCIGLAAIYTDAQLIPDAGVDILNVVLSFKNISQSFRMRLAATLGNLLASRDRYDKAMEYYNLVDINYLNDRYIEQMLSAFVRAGYYKQAVDLIVKKPHCISDRGLFHAIKTVAADDNYNSEIADAAYELLLKSWYDKGLIDVVLNHYNGGQEEWQELARSLSGIQVYDAKLDEMILYNSIWMHMPDAGSQKVFLRMAESSPGGAMCAGFVYYLIYEMLINDFKPEYETLEYLEKTFLNNGDRFLAYALFHFYAEQSAHTVRSEEITGRALDLMQEDDILLPSVAKLKDKNASRPYILKNQPFMYRTLPGRQVYLYYKFDSDEEFFRVRMKYTRYGLYMRVLPVFYGESVTYRFIEEMGSGSIATPDLEIENLKYSLLENSDDVYFKLNNAFIYENMFKYDQVEKIITDNVGNARAVMGNLI